MRLHRLRSFADYYSYREKERDELATHDLLLASMLPPEEREFEVKGFSYVAGQEVMFKVDFQWSGHPGQVNWRDRVSCPITGFTNRWRATIHLVDIEMEAYPASSIYMTEQVTPLFEYFARRYRNIVGSEYLGAACQTGNTNANGVRNENLCALSFANHSFDMVLSYDVIEHIPDPSRVFGEIYRVLRPKGRLHWTVPFSPYSERNITRAHVKDGQIEHLLPPEYHGDPLSSSGVLCFTNFGWEMFEMARSAGFRDVYAVVFHSVEFAYLSEQLQFFALK